MIFDKWLRAGTLMAVLCPMLSAQQEEDKMVQAILERWIENTASTVDYLDLYEQVTYYLKHPVNINRGSGEQLQALPLLSMLQINAIITHLESYGDFISLYELQTLEELDATAIELLVHFVTIDKDWQEDHTPVKNMFRKASHELVTLYHPELQQKKGYRQRDHGGPIYQGAPFRLLARYRYTYGNRLSIGFSAEKDAGEEFFSGSNRQGFDFYSAHLFLRNTGRVKELALGDYQAAFGQGLTLGTGLSFGKSAFVSNIRKNASGFRPYRASNENDFLRGAATTLRFGRSEVSVFASINKADATAEEQDMTFSSFGSTGLHRTATEIANKNTVKWHALGAHAGYSSGRATIGATFAYLGFDKRLVLTSRPYNYFYFQGTRSVVAGIHYSYLYGNIHFFGETATGNSSIATLNGLVAALGQAIDLSVLYRYYPRQYPALFTHAFGENSRNRNEEGLYTGIAFRPARKWQVNSYLDIFRFPWLSYRADAPSRGRDFLAEIQYLPTRRTSLYFRYRNDEKEQNMPGNDLAFDHLVPIQRRVFRFHIQYQLQEHFTFKTRVEWLRYQVPGKAAEQGSLLYQDVAYKPLGKRYSATFRFVLFGTDSYNSRVYAFENDVLQTFSIPALQDAGSRWYLLIRYKATRQADIWIRYAQTNYYQMEATGSGADEVQSPLRSDLKIQLRLRF